MEINLKVSDEAKTFILEALNESSLKYTPALVRGEAEGETIWTIGLLTIEQVSEFRSSHAQSGQNSYVTFSSLELFITNPEDVKEIDGKILAYGSEYLHVQSCQ